MSYLYLAALLVSIAGMVVLDVRFKLFFATTPLRAAIVLVVGVAFFLAWDVAGITLGIFFRGAPDLLSGVLLAPELPLEELFFLTLLCYTTMNAYGLFRGLSSARRSRTRIETGSADS
ncbi:lycopene cyclase domain-containing protein [Pseudolysinimonas sp.]|uniref:lycopene cyclase domain-containing protein n=1 Tax=Pseudolysinimonas sp. TaxID=2680009 RepID=UPI00286BBC73|nr:lycopene cyclase domain-containing protein [Pseudolysinimonas sp.]